MEANSKSPLLLRTMPTTNSPPFEFGPKACAREHAVVGSEAASEGAGTVSNNDKNNDSTGQIDPNQEEK
jgi:hypothetical protein